MYFPHSLHSLPPSSPTIPHSLLLPYASARIREEISSYPLTAQGTSSVTRRAGFLVNTAVDLTLSQNTNVVELCNRLVKDRSQLTYYNSGIGTYATPSWKSWTYRKQVWGHKLDLAIAWYDPIVDGVLLSTVFSGALRGSSSRHIVGSAKIMKRVIAFIFLVRAQPVPFAVTDSS